MDSVFAETLIAVIEEGTMARAATRMGVTPGAVSLRIRALEKELSSVLITRVGRRMEPTPAAIRVVPALREIVQSAKTAKRLAVDKAPGGELRLGTIATATVGLLPPLLVELAATSPAVELFVEPGTSIELRDRVRRGALDAALIVEPPEPLRKAEQFEPWLSEPFVMIAPSDCEGKDPHELLRSMPFIRYDRHNWGGRLVDDWLAADQIVVDDRIELDALDGITALVSAGLGVAIMPDWHGPRLSGTSFCRIPLPEPCPNRTIGLFYLRASPREDLVRIFRESRKRALPAGKGNNELGGQQA